MSDLYKLPIKLGWVLLKTEFSKRSSLKMIRQLQGSNEERILLQKIGKYWNQQNWFDRPDGLVVLTSQRLVFLSKQKTFTSTTDFLSFPLEMMVGIAATRVMMISPAVVFSVDGVSYTFSLLRNAHELVDALNAAKRNLPTSGTKS